MDMKESINEDIKSIKIIPNYIVFIRKLIQNLSRLKKFEIILP